MSQGPSRNDHRIPDLSQVQILEVLYGYQAANILFQPHHIDLVRSIFEDLFQQGQSGPAGDDARPPALLRQTGHLLRMAGQSKWRPRYRVPERGSRHPQAAVGVRSIGNYVPELLYAVRGYSRQDGSVAQYQPLVPGVGESHQDYALGTHILQVGAGLLQHHSIVYPRYEHGSAVDLAVLAEDL